MVFPLLELPMVAMGQVIGGMGSSELFELHQCSMLTTNVIRPYEKFHKCFKTGVDFQRNWVEIRGVRKFYALPLPTGDDARDFEKTRVFEGCEVPVEVLDEKNVNTFWPERETIDGVMKIGSSFIRSLGMGTLDQILIARESPAEEILAWADKQNVQMESFNLIAAPAGYENVVANRVFSDAFFRKVTLNFTSMLEPVQPFEVNFVADRAIKMNKLQLQHTSWFNGRHLLAFDAHCIILYHSNLTSEDINAWFKAWYALGYMRTMYLSIHLAEGHQFSLKKIIKDVVPDAGIRADAGAEIITIRRSDKKEAEICVADNGREFSAWIEDPNVEQ